MKIKAEFDFDVKNAKKTLELAGFDIKGKSDRELADIVFERLTPYAMDIKKYSIKDSKKA